MKLDFDPCTVSHFSDGKYLIIAGSDGRSALYSRDGVFLGVIADSKDKWMWSVVGKPDSTIVVSVSLDECCSRPTGSGSFDLSSI